ncbi:MAG: alpha-L-fucosidase [Chloroflexi bacterium]|nr:alpha-L-fucosidase [Chloroflexota bacterium]
MTFAATIESVRQHQIPDWYHDAKFGIFIHWGLYSVPGWAPLSGDISQTIKELGPEYWFASNSYAEWYLNSMKFENGPTRKYHDATYGPDFAYEDFAPHFNEAVKNWNPEDMAALFQRAGARYTVLTTKHHDGFTLWPSAHPCPTRPGYQASRDVTGELSSAVRARGLRMGLYYSGGLDWAVSEARVENLRDVWGTIVQTPEFVAYSTAHWRELIDRYQPSIMWNDIGAPWAMDLPELFAYYYNQVPDGVINDRFGQTMPVMKENGGIEGHPVGVHYDYVTPEYASFETRQTQKWETTRGIGHSFGYNRDEGDDQLLALPALVHLFVDIVSKNGNLLLNVGPMADGTIPANQRERLEEFGRWLDVNGEGMFGTRPWSTAESETTDGLGVRFTTQGEAVYATLLGTPGERKISIVGLGANLNTSCQLLGQASVLPWQQDGDNLTITLPEQLPDSPAHSLKLMAVSVP